MTILRIASSPNAYNGLKCERLHGSVEDAGGLLTDFEAEESPLSIVQAVDTSRDTEMGRSMVQKRTMSGVYDESERTRLPYCR